MTTDQHQSSTALDEFEAFLGPDAPVPAEDRAPAEDEPRGAGARSPLFWKLLLVAMALVWGYSFVGMKGVLDRLPAFVLLTCRFLPAALLMLLLFHQRIRRHFNRRNIVVGVMMGVVLWAAYALQTLGLAGTTPGKNAFLTGIYCVLVPFISYALAREPLTRYNIGAAVLCVAGIAFVALDSLTVEAGDALTLLGAFFFAVQLAMISKFGRDLDVNVITFWMFLVVGALSLAASVTAERWPGAAAWTPDVVGTLVFLSVVCTCVALLIQNLSLSHVPASTGSLLLSLESPSGVLFSVIVAGEVLSARLITGFALIFLAIVLSETHFSFLRRVLSRRG